MNTYLIVDDSKSRFEQKIVGMTDTFQEAEKIKKKLDDKLNHRYLLDRKESLKPITEPEPVIIFYIDSEEKILGRCYRGA